MKTLRNALLCLLLLAVAGPAFAAEPYRVYMVLWRGMTDAEKGFQDYFAEQRIPVKFIVRNAAEDPAAVPALVAEIRREKPDLVYVFGTTATQLIAGSLDNRDPKRHITDIPVVFNIVADPLGGRLTESLAGSGRNVTGASHVVPLDTQLRAMATLGDFKRVGALYNALEPNSRVAVEQLVTAFAERGVSFVPEPIPLEDGKPTLAGVEEAVAKLAKEKVELVYLPSDSFLINAAQEVVPLLHRHGLASFSATEGPIRKAGALIGIVSNYYTVGKFAGFKARQILVDGRKPGEVPIETLAKYTFLVNLETMRALKFYPPVTVLQFAEVVGDPR